MEQSTYQEMYGMLISRVEDAVAILSDLEEDREQKMAATLSLLEWGKNYANQMDLYAVK